MKNQNNDALIAVVEGIVESGNEGGVSSLEVEWNTVGYNGSTISYKVSVKYRDDADAG